MKIYLDSCSLQRPLDDQAQIRIATETEAVLGVLSLWESGKIDLIGSEALDYEAEQIPKLERRAYMKELLAKMEETIIITDSISQRAAFLVSNGIKPLDALHLACAEEVKADYFCTSDDKLLKKAKKLAIPATQVVSPLELVTKLP
ncbi:MAG: PIN domain-containing protein [Saprospiraceae bacterium]